MTTARPYRRAAFTLIEMIVVITIIMLMFGTLMSGLATMQKATDTLSTPAVIQAVHESCYRNARQFGSAALVYGFTLDFGDTVASPGDNKTSLTAVPTETASAIGIFPWVIVAGQTYHQADIDLFTDIGRQPLWNGNRIYFDDKLRPSRRFGIQTGAVFPAPLPGVVYTNTSACRFLHVAYEPRTGMVHTDLDNTSSSLADQKTEIKTKFAANLITDPIAPVTHATQAPTQLTLELRDTKNNQVKNKIIIHYTGVIDAHAKL